MLLSTRDDVITAVSEGGLRREYDKDVFEMGFSRDSYLRICRWEISISVR